MSDLNVEKRALRAEVRARRQAQSEKVAVSQRVIRRLLSLPEVRAAETLAFYVGVRSEVRTDLGIATTLEQGKRVAVPYCVADRLELFLLRDLNELRPGSYSIPEPDVTLRRLPERCVPTEACDIVVVPGLAFDRRGGRLGHGRGFYDRLLVGTRPDAVRIALAFECQIVEKVPTEPHDVPMDCVVSEQTVYRTG